MGTQVNMTDKSVALEWKNKGNDAFKNQDFKLSIECFTKAIAADNTDHVLYSNRSGAYASALMFEKALDDANKCVRLNPNWAKGWSRKGFAEMNLRRFEDAESSYRRGLETEASNQACRDGLRQVMEARKASTHQLDSTRLMLALKFPQFASAQKDETFQEQLKDLMENGTFDMSKANRDLVEAVQMAVTYTADELQEKLKLAEKAVETLKEKKKQEEAARKEAERLAAEQAKPAALKEAEALKELGTAEYKKKNFDAALELYKKAYDTYPQELIFLNNMAAVYMEMNNLEEAHKVVDEALAKRYDVRCPFETAAKLYQRKASIYTKQNNHAQAVNMLEKAITEDNNKVIRAALSEAQRAATKAAAEAYINPELAQEHRTKGNELFKNKQYAAAKKEYDEAIRRNPKDVSLYTNRASALCKLLEYPSALKDAEKAIEIDPSFVKAYARKGACHFFMKEYNKAMEAYQRGLNLDSENAECRKGLEDTIMKVGETQRSGQVDEEQMRHSMADPEIQRIMADPQFQMILQRMQENPATAAQLMQDPAVAKNISKLAAAGILRMG
eukprot:GDKJ01018938.1.p1 GENE.GDKJ01018938.1~~GDKJ01018938.1.p1  ORF type:complete len:561 (-),score=167.20 GDKJ01018938.1:190-1872(-)